MGHELKGREIFATGNWNNMDFTDTDLEDIVANFEKLKDTHKVPLKFGHNEEQAITDGQPAIGWVSRIYKMGSKLFADFSDMPRTVFEAIKNKLYRTVSIELLFNVDNDGNKFNHVLDAVALLGADHPAVNSLADLNALLATRTEFVGGHRVAFETIAGSKELMNKSEVEMDEKQVQALLDKALAPLTEQNAKLTKDLADEKLKTAQFSEKAAADEKKAAEGKVKLARKAVTDVLDIAVKAKALTPAMRETYEKQIGVADDTRVTAINLEEVKSMFSVKDTDLQQGLHKQGDDEDDVNDPEAKLLALTYQNQATTGKPFNVAFSLVSQANPKLHRAYLDANGEK